MELKQTSFEQQLAFGQEGEHEVAQWLIKRGVTVLPLYQFNAEQAPVLLHKTGSTISPDLICFNKEVFMVEVKTKRGWVRFDNKIETGFNERHYHHYKEIQRLTGRGVYVFFNHKNHEPNGIYYARLDDYTRIWNGVAKGDRVYDPLVLYNIDVLTKIDID